MTAASTWPLRALVLRETVPMGALLDALGLPGGRNGQLHCPNPQHPDRHPSARLYGDKVHCFTCAQTWDVVGLAAVVNSQSFPDAVEYLEQLFGVSTATDPGMVAAVLRRRGTVDPSGLAEFVAGKLREVRGHVPLHRYAMWWRAFDLSRTQYASKTIDVDTYVAALDRILAVLPPDGVSLS